MRKIYITLFVISAIAILIAGCEPKVTPRTNNSEVKTARL